MTVAPKWTHPAPHGAAVCNGTGGVTSEMGAEILAAAKASSNRKGRDTGIVEIHEVGGTATPTYKATGEMHLDATIQDMARDVIGFEDGDVEVSMPWWVNYFQWLKVSASPDTISLAIRKVNAREYSPTDAGTDNKIRANKQRRSSLYPP
jgi:hypothetical protein